MRARATPSSCRPSARRCSRSGPMTRCSSSGGPSACSWRAARRRWVRRPPQRCATHSLVSAVMAGHRCGAQRGSQDLTRGSRTLAGAANCSRRHAEPTHTAAAHEQIAAEAERQHSHVCCSAVHTGLWASRQQQCVPQQPTCTACAVAPQALRELQVVAHVPDLELAAAAAMVTAHESAKVVDQEAILELNSKLEVRPVWGVRGRGGVSACMDASTERASARSTQERSAARQIRHQCRPGW